MAGRRVGCVLVGPWHAVLHLCPPMMQYRALLLLYRHQGVVWVLLWMVRQRHLLHCHPLLAPAHPHLKGRLVRGEDAPRRLPQGVGSMALLGVPRLLGVRIWQRQEAGLHLSRTWCIVSSRTRHFPPSNGLVHTLLVHLGPGLNI
jgi:hypothetical protein